MPVVPIGSYLKMVSFQSVPAAPMMSLISAAVEQSIVLYNLSNYQFQIVRFTSACVNRRLRGSCGR